VGFVGGRRAHAADAQQVGWRRAEAAASPARATRAHADARGWCGGRRRLRRVRGSGLRQLIGDRLGFGGASNLEVVAAPPEVDDAIVVRVLQHTNEHAVAEALAVAPEKLTRL